MIFFFNEVTLGVRFLAKGFHLSRGIEGGETFVIHSTHRQFLPDPDPQPRVTSQTLYPLGHDCPQML